MATCIAKDCDKTAAYHLVPQSDGTARKQFVWGSMREELARFCWQHATENAEANNRAVWSKAKQERQTTPAPLQNDFVALFKALDFEVDSWKYRDDDVEDQDYYDATELARLVRESRDAMRQLLSGHQTPTPNPARDAWVQWLLNYGPGQFYDAFSDIAQDAESECTRCHEKIYLDIVEGGGIPDWRTADGDYGCSDSPDSTDDGSGDHVPAKLRQLS